MLVIQMDMPPFLSQIPSLIWVSSFFSLGYGEMVDFLLLSTSVKWSFSLADEAPTNK